MDGVSVFATNDGRYVRDASEPRQVTCRDKACSSPTRRTVAKESKNNVFFVRSLKEADRNGSYGGRVRDINTSCKSQGGCTRLGTGSKLEKDRISAVRAEEEEISGYLKPKIADNMDL